MPSAPRAHFTKHLSLQGLVVNVSILHPGTTAPDRMADLVRQAAAADGISEDEVRRRNAATAGIRRLVRPRDVVEAVALLYFPRGRHNHGVGFAIDGGTAPGI